MCKEYDFHKLPENRQEYTAWLEKIARQENEMFIMGEITCVCNMAYRPTQLYRCYHCGIWFCPVCAKKHFGKRPKGKYNYKNYFKEKENEQN